MTNLTDKQQDIINEYTEKYGGVQTWNEEHAIVLMFERNMVLSEGIPYKWLEKFNEVFHDVTIGLIDGQPIHPYQYRNSVYIRLTLEDE
jgi:hypothetical protein